jgi:hypothetical protein
LVPLLVENRFAKEHANVQVLVVRDGDLRDGAGVVEHGGREGNSQLYFFLRLHAGHFVFEFGESVKDISDLLIDEILEMLGVAFDLDDDISIVIFYLIDGEGPISVNQLLLLRLR